MSRNAGMMIGVLSVLFGSLPVAQASNCSVISTGLVPINDLGPGLYLGQFEGGLYPNGSNQVPPAHASVGVARARSIQPLDPAGNPDPTGKYVLLSVGMSNTTQEFCSQSSALPCDPWTFMGQAAVHPDVNQTSLAIVNGAQGGQASASWDSPNDANYNRIRDTRLAPQGLSEAQVQIAWIKTANPGPTVSLPGANADADTLVGQMADIARAMKLRYPNLQLVFFSSRIYAGYASTALNPEPFSYESGFAIKWLIEAQINQMAGGGTDPIAADLDYNTVAPWIAWGPYPWADGLTPRSDGLIWECSDLQNDGTHPAMAAEEKVGSMLLDFMLSSPFAAPWFRTKGPGQITGGMSGSWFNPDQSGHGFALEVIDIPGKSNPELLAYWFTYMDGEQAWVIGSGPIDGDSAVLPTRIFSGADFPPNFDPADAVSTDWGTLTFSFSDCQNGTVDWDSVLPDFGSGSLSIVRLSNIAGMDCIETKRPEPAKESELALTGLPGATCSTAGGSNCPGAIPDADPAGVTSEFEVSGCASIADVNVGLDVSHSWIGDLLATVVSPAGTPVTLIDQPGVPAASAFGCGEDDIFAILDDETVEPAEDRCDASPPPPAAIDGTFSPANPLSAFDGENSDGTWMLDIADAAAQDTGTLNDWSLEITCAGAITPGFSASWFNPDESGHGFVLEVVEIPGKSSPELLAYWFTYMDGKQVWLIGLGPIDGASAVLPTRIFSGADFPPNFDPADAGGSDWGTLTFTFSDCKNGAVTWDSTVPGFGSGSLEIVRLTALTGLACP